MDLADGHLLAIEYLFRNGGEYINLNLGTGIGISVLELVKCFENVNKVKIPYEFNGSNKVASAKSAFIPKTRVQVYFLEDSVWFEPLTNLVYKSKNGRILADNGERYCIFSKAVLNTVSDQLLIVGINDSAYSNDDILDLLLL